MSYTFFIPLESICHDDMFLQHGSSKLISLRRGATTTGPIGADLCSHAARSVSRWSHDSSFLRAVGNRFKSSALTLPSCFSPDCFTLGSSTFSCLARAPHRARAGTPRPVLAQLRTRAGVPHARGSTAPLARGFYNGPPLPGDSGAGVAV